MKAHVVPESVVTKAQQEALSEIFSKWAAEQKEKIREACDLEIDSITKRIIGSCLLSCKQAHLSDRKTAEIRNNLLHNIDVFASRKADMAADDGIWYELRQYGWEYEYPKTRT